MDKNILLAIRHMGSATALAKAIGVSPQTVCFWRDKKRKISADHCSAIERVTNGIVTRKDLRPNNYMYTWPELADNHKRTDK